MKHLTQKSLNEILRLKAPKTVGDLKNNEFAYVPVAALGVAFTTNACGPYVYVDRNAPVYWDSNWQQKPGLIGIRRVLDGVVLNTNDTACFYAMKVQFDKSHHSPFQRLAANPHMNLWLPVLMEAE